jgi:dsRNA-specific ribonuclease
MIDGDVLGRGEASSKKKAEQEAASLALEAVQKRD